jgi:hypothetical protein
MKKLFMVIIALATLFMAPLTQAAAPGTCTVSYASVNSEVSTITWAWTASVDDGSVPNTASSSFNGWVFMATTDPDSGAAPQNDYDIELRDADSVDIFGGELADRDTATSEHAVPLIGTAYYGPRFVNGVLTMVLTNNNVVSAKGTLKVYYYRTH